LLRPLSLAAESFLRRARGPFLLYAEAFLDGPGRIARHGRKELHMRLDLRVGTMAAAAALCLPVVAAGQRPVVEGMSQRLTVGSGDRKVSMGASGDGASMSAKRGDPAPARPASSSSRAASSAPAATAGSGLPILVPTNQQVKTMDCEGRPVSVQGNGNRLTLK